MEGHVLWKLAVLLTNSREIRDDDAALKAAQDATICLVDAGDFKYAAESDKVAGQLRLMNRALRDVDEGSRHYHEAASYYRREGMEVAAVEAEAELAKTLELIGHRIPASDEQAPPSNEQGVIIHAHQTRFLGGRRCGVAASHDTPFTVPLRPRALRPTGRGAGRREGETFQGGDHATPRMTTRRWMIAVAMVGIVLGIVLGGGVWLKQRRDYFLSMARSHQKEVASSTAEGKALRSRFGTSGMSNEEIMHLYRDFDRMMDRADHHAAMARKFERAARYPWLPVESDPPEPE